MATRKKRGRGHRRSRRSSFNLVAALIGLVMHGRPGTLYQAARYAQTSKVWFSGSPGRILRRHKNKIIGKFAFRSGLLGRLWR